ncbi:type II secretion system GspH family protein [Patescibacteria group bacterium]|nr:type II secretion system GspH family protein [Patescibacteria group bacterium]
MKKLLFGEKLNKEFTPVECQRAIPPKRNYSTGFTLTEIIIVTAIFTIIAGVIFSAIIYSQNL